MEENRELSTIIQGRDVSKNGLAPNEFYADEKLFRAVPVHNPNMIDKSGHVTSAVFKDSKGLSVDRKWHRDLHEAVNELRNRIASIKGKKIEDFIVISVKKSDCDSVNAHCEYSPETDNLYHSLIKQSSVEITLTRPQARSLVKVAVVEDC